MKQGAGNEFILPIFHDMFYIYIASAPVAH